jgi:hypothetical protein
MLEPVHGHRVLLGRGGAKIDLKTRRRTRYVQRGDGHALGAEALIKHIAWPKSAHRVTLLSGRRMAK